MVGTDHFHQLWLDNMPQFLVGNAALYDANWYNEEREFGLPRMQDRPGTEDLVRAPAARTAWTRLRPGIQQRAADRPQHHLPDHHAAARGRPADRAGLHQHLRAAAAAAEALRPAGRAIREHGRGAGRATSGSPIIGTGHLSLELGGPRQFGPHGPDPEFDARAVEWIANGDLEGCLAEVTLDSLHAPGNATHGFMDFMLMMGVAGENAKADYVDTLDLFHTMEAYFTWYPEGAPAVSKYLLNKFLYTVDRDPELVERYREDPRGTVTWWEAEAANSLLNCAVGERDHVAGVHRARSATRCATHDYPALFELGAHPFLTLTLFIAMFERDHDPLEYQKAYGAALSGQTLPYPDIAT